MGSHLEPELAQTRPWRFVTVMLMSVGIRGVSITFPCGQAICETPRTSRPHYAIICSTSTRFRCGRSFGRRYSPV